MNASNLTHMPTPTMPTPPSLSRSDLESESFSALFDGQLSAEQALALVKQSLQSEPSQDVLMSQWRSMSRISQALASSEALGRSETLGRPAVLSAPAMPAVTAAPAANDSVFRWRIAAGFAGLAAIGSLAWGLLQTQSPSTSGAVIAEKKSIPAVLANAPNAATEGNSAVMLRDPHLDQLLAAHKQFAGASALQQSAGALRSANWVTAKP